MGTVTIPTTLLACGGMIIMFLGLWLGRLMYGDWQRPTDPWAMQRKLMEISGQSLPDKVCVTPHSLLYLALVMEELAETINPVMACMRRAWRINPGGNAPTAQLEVWTHLTRLAGDLESHSKTVRSLCARMDEFKAYANLQEAVDIADGVTDLAVTLCGLTLASGVPGAHCYDEVAESNLSKANPITGLIDKDATGKWIKGVNYRTPDLLARLDAHGALNMY